MPLVPPEVDRYLKGYIASADSSQLLIETYLTFPRPQTRPQILYCSWFGGWARSSPEGLVAWDANFAAKSLNEAMSVACDSER